MARRRLLGDDLWARHLEPPTDEREIARHFTLTRDDLLAIASKRTAATRLGFALLLLYLRCPGRVLEVGEVPPDVVLTFVARQLGITARVFDDYAVRDSTRREHLAEIMAAGGYAVFSRAVAREMVGLPRSGRAADRGLRRSRTACSPAAWMKPCLRGSTACWPCAQPAS